jgi:NADH-quinone oxidoreductase subunit E
MVEALKQNSANSSATPKDSAVLAEASNPLSLHPFIVSQFAVAAAATAFGFGVASHMASFVFRGAQEALANTAEPEKDSGDAASVPAASHAVAVTEAAVHGEVIVEAAGVSVKSRQRRSDFSKVVVKRPDVRKTASVSDGVIAKKTRVKTKTSDLKRISGVGPKIEELLHKLGVVSLNDVAAWTPTDVARIDLELGLDGRILRDDWIGQAQKLKSI